MKVLFELWVALQTTKGEKITQLFFVNLGRKMSAFACKQFLLLLLMDASWKKCKENDNETTRRATSRGNDQTFDLSCFLFFTQLRSKQLWNLRSNCFDMCSLQASSSFKVFALFVYLFFPPRVYTNWNRNILQSVSLKMQTVFYYIFSITVQKLVGLKMVLITQTVSDWSKKVMWKQCSQSRVMLYLPLHLHALDLIFE